MRTHCEPGGVWYSTRPIGEKCGDRSAALRLRTLAELGEIALQTERPDTCRGRLVRPED